MKNELLAIGNRVKTELKNYIYPKGFNPENALEAAYIIFSENDGFPQCSNGSKYKAILSMMSQGLNPLKGQCHFVPYRNELVLIRDYSGSVMVAKDADDRISDIRAKVVRSGDEFDFEIKNGMFNIISHKPTLGSLDSENFIAVYAVAVGKDGEVIDSEIMSYGQYLNHLRRYCRPIKGVPIVDKNGNINKYSNYAKHPEQMIKKTVIHKLCRQIIKTSPNEDIAKNEDDVISDDEMIVEVSELERKVIDFKSVPKKEIEAAPMAEKHHGREIARLSAKLGENGDMIKNISEFFERDIEKIRELTLAEAVKYIKHLNVKLDIQAQEQVEAQPSFMS
jgi:recombination protein RecT